MKARRLLVVAVLSVFATTACKGCKKDSGEGTNPSLEDLAVEDCDNGEDDNGDGWTDCEQPVCQLQDVCAFEPPDPATLAPELDPMNLVGFADSVRFLWQGDNPVVRGVDLDALDETRISVLRARVVDASGNPVAGILANVAGQPRLGYTFSREDGAIDLVANGDAPATIRMQATGYLAVDRTVDAPARDFVSAEPVVLTPITDKVTKLDGGGLAEGAVTSDDDGERSPRVYFPDDTVATVELPDGQKGDLSVFNVRLTEYTVGDTGPDAMPAFLPDETGYTYAVELSLDEAEELGALSVSFNNTGWLYLDNFLDFEVGTPVPSGYYSRARTQWEAERNGRVLERVGDGVDIDGSGSAASKSAREAIELTDAELDKIKATFGDGESFWRVPVNHFSPYDLNWPYGLPEGAVRPDEIYIKPPVEQDPCVEAGSIIECQNQVVMKSVALPGTGHSLVYRSDRTEGRLRAFELPLTGTEVASVLKKIIVVVDLLGRQTVEEFEPAPNLTFQFEWDGKDAYGRHHLGTTPITVRVAHVYEAQFTEPTAFGEAGGGDVRPTRADVPIWRQFRGPFGSFDARATLNMGGWALDLQHAYDGGRQAFYPAPAPEIQRGDLSRVITNFEFFSPPTGLPFEPGESLFSNLSVYSASDGALFIFLHAANHDATVVVKRHPDGRLEHYAGRVTLDFELPRDCQVGGDCGEGGPIKEAYLPGLRWAVGPDDALYLGSGNCLRRVTQDSMERIAGPCLGGEEPEGQDVDVPNIDYIAIGPNSEIYLSGGSNIVRVYAGTRRVELVAGGGDNDPRVAEGANAFETKIGVEGLVATNDGKVYFFDMTETLVEIENGRLRVRDFSDESRLMKGWAAGPDGSVYWFETKVGRVVLKRYKAGNVSVLGGDSEIDPRDTEALAQAFDANNIPASEAYLFPLGPPAIASDGSIYFGTLWDADKDLPGGDADVEPLIKRIASAYPDTLAGDEALLASPNARHMYRFAPTGQLQDIRSSWNGLMLEALGYGDDGLESVTNRDGLAVTVERDAQGRLAAIVGPYGHRTEVSLDDNGYIAEFRYPDDSVRRAQYTDRGLMTGWQDAVGAESSYAYDALGFLTRAEDPEGGWKTLTRTRTGVILDTSSGRRIDYSADVQQVGRTTIITDAAGLMWQTTENRSERELQEPDGTIKTTRLTNDPRFGQQSQFVGYRRTLTPAGVEQVSQRSREVILRDGDPLGVASMLETIDVNGAITTVEYNGSTHTVVRTSPEGRTQTYAFDDRNRNIEISVGDLDPVNVGYDADGRMNRVEQGGRSSSWTFGSRGYPAEISGPDGGVVRLLRDANGRVTEFTSPSGNVMTTLFDAVGRPTGISTGSATTFTQDFNGVDRLTAFKSPSGDADRYGWTEDRVLDSIQRANGMQRQVFRDDVGRATGWSSANGDVTRTFDPMTGQALRSQTSDGSVEFEYDGFLITGREVAFQGQVHTVSRQHDNNFRLVNRSVDGETVETQFDADGLPSRVGEITLTLDPDLPLVNQAAVGNVVTDYLWDSNGRLQRVTHRDGNSTLFDATYAYDAASRLTSIDESIEGVSATRTFTYDGDGQLTEARRDGVSEASFTYDERGNRTSLSSGASATYDTSDRILTADTRTYTVDASGFVTGWSDGPETVQLDYDHHDLIRASTTAGEFAYGYDSLGRRIWRTVDGVFDRGWIYDDTNRPLGESDGTGALVSRFVYATTDAVPAYLVRGGATYRIVTDQVGSVRLVVDVGTGQVVQRLDYDLLGRVIADSNPGFQPFGFAGGLHDGDTGLVRLGRRDYDTFTGRWTSPDPRGFSGRQGNLFAYAHNDCINLVDSDGELAWAFIAKGLVVAGIVLTPLWVPAVQWSTYESESNARAQEIASRRGIGRVDAENAMRHCIGQCAYNKLTLHSGIAEASGDYHENPDVPKTVFWVIPTGGGGEQNRPGNVDYWDSLKDKHNNVCGRACSQQDDCVECCAQELESGQLATDMSASTMVSEDPLFTPAPVMTIN